MSNHESKAKDGAHERTVKEIHDLLTRKESVLPEEGYQDASMAAPEEIKERIERYLKETPEVIGALTKDLLDRQHEMQSSQDPEIHAGLRTSADLLTEMEEDFAIRVRPLVEEILRVKLGGSTRKQMVDVYNSFDFSSYWFQQGFGRRDSEVINRCIEQVSQDLFIPVSELNMLDVGTGNGRIIRMAAEEVRKIHPAGAESFIRNIRGFDLVRKVVEDARMQVAEIGIPSEAVFEGDFLNLHEEHQRWQYHIITAMMHTPWHCTTEKEWISFLKNMENALAPGGCLIFDTVAIDTLDAELPDLPADPKELLEDEEGMKIFFRDLLNFYGILRHKYCDDMQPVIDDLYDKYRIEKPEKKIRVPRLIELPRRFVRDSTAGVTGKSFVREVPDAIWIKKLCQNQGIDLSVTGSFTKGILIENESELQKMGFEWLLKSQLRDWLMVEIAERILPKKRAEKIREYLSSLSKDRQRQLPQEMEDDLSLIREFYNKIALLIAKNYTNRYLVFRKSAM